MTTTTTPIGQITVDADSGTTILTRESGETIRARTPAENRTLLDRAHRAAATKDFVLRAKGVESTNVLGLYIEAVAHTASGSPFAHMRFFICGPNVYHYSRTVGDTRANWRHSKHASLPQALDSVQRAINKDTVQVLGIPVLVELTPDDVSNMEAGQMPSARFRGQYRIERDYGRFDFKSPVNSRPLPNALVNALRSEYVIAVADPE